MTRRRKDLDSVEERKKRFFYSKCCAYCRNLDDLEIDSIQPYTWADESIWKLSDYELEKLFVSDLQVLCNECLLRKKRLWKSFRNEGGEWLNFYLEEAKIE
jgi:hypothetical protein